MHYYYHPSAVRNLKIFETETSFDPFLYYAASGLPNYISQPIM